MESLESVPEVLVPRNRDPVAPSRLAPSLPDYPCNSGAIPPVLVGSGEYTLRFARDAGDLDGICALRFEVYNLEMNEGLEESFETRRDVDEFDAQCHHLMVIHRSSGQCVGTYRMQTGPMAMLRRGFYTGQEFDLARFPRHFLDHSVEVGRACIHRLHRNGRVLQLLWKGLARYMDWNGKRHLFGCCSLPSEDPAAGMALYHHLRLLDFLHPDLAAAPWREYACEASSLSVLEAAQPRLPRLFEGYLNLGGRICGEPALDRRFKTIDFLVALDIHDMTPGTFRKLLA